MKLLLLVLTVSLVLAQVTSVMKCWRKQGRCRTTCKNGEVFHILCNVETKCCVEQKYVPFRLEASNTT
ncbi:beta-defensin 121 [Loxodonta africana]|uniref:beta-defensin 121 n=1 Tax=Loxodonta africana TaxID=9785 RepID=UPI000C813FC7|nr:beta-defensin 121 [Loxodonta africana]XP_049725094.1 beta-defensin 121 [Elephas maximus indicus]